MVVGGGDLDPVPGRAVSQISQAWADLEGQTMSEGPTWSGQTEAAPEGVTPSPLPWQVSDKAAAASLAQVSFSSRYGGLPQRWTGSNIHVRVVLLR